MQSSMLQLDLELGQNQENIVDIAEKFPVEARSHRRQ
jgi:hypothetical protein